jgi:beta-lactam-binding protein with PASTA domain
VRRGIVDGWPVRAEFVEQAAVSDETAVTIEERLPTGPPPGPPVEPPPDRELWPWLLVLLVLILAGIAIVYFATRNDTSTARQASTQAVVVQPRTAPSRSTTPALRSRAPLARVSVPRLVGLPTPTALKRLRQLGFMGATHNVFSDKPRNVVVAQTPGSSRKLTRGDTVLLNVSKGPQAVAVPDVLGQTVADALNTLRSQAFKPRIVPVPSVEPAGQVLAQHPTAGTKARPGIAVRLNVSKGKQAASTGTNITPTTTAPATANQATAPTTETAPANASPLVRVPDLEGKKLIDARRLVQQVGLVIEIRRVPSAEPLGTVIAQAKKPDTRLKQGTHLLVTVSKGQKPSASTTQSQSGSQPIAIPDVTGEDEITANQDLESAGLTVRVVDRDTADASEDGVVIEQTPAANQSVQPNSTVTIYVGRYTGG